MFVPRKFYYVEKVPSGTILIYYCIQCHKESSMELDKILYRESSLRNFYNYTIKFPTEDKYIQRDVFKNYYVVEFPSGINYYVIEFPSGINIM